MCWIRGSGKLNRLLKKAHLLRWSASALAATYFQYAWTQRTGYPGLRRAALQLDLLSSLLEAKDDRVGLETGCFQAVGRLSRRAA